LRDKTHGRIYRLVAKNGKESPKLDLKNAKPAELMAALKSDNMFWRKHAQRLLTERGNRDVWMALIKLIQDKSVDEVGQNAGGIHAIWTTDGLQMLSDDPNADRDLRAVESNVQDALKHKSPAVRRNAALALPRSYATAMYIARYNLLDDNDSHIKLA